MCCSRRARFVLLNFESFFCLFVVFVISFSMADCEISGEVFAAAISYVETTHGPKVLLSFF